MLAMPKRFRDGSILSRADVSKVSELPHAGNKSFKAKAFKLINHCAKRTATHLIAGIRYAIESGEHLTTRVVQSCCGHPQTIRIVGVDSIRVKCMKCGKISKGMKA